MARQATQNTAPATTYPAVVGKVLERLRRNKGVDQGDFAGMIGVTQPTWSRIENGASGLSVEQLAAAADALGSTPAQILKHADDAAAELERQGVRVLPRREQPSLGSGMALIAGAVIAAVLVTLLAKGK